MAPIYKSYVIGFLFRPSSFGLEVALITKNRPPQQAGKLNGIGGKVEPGELFIEAMRREFLEETGVAVQDWRECGSLIDPRYADLRIILFTANAASDCTLLSQTDESVAWYPVSQLHTHDNLMPELREIIPAVAAGSTIHKLASY